MGQGKEGKVYIGKCCVVLPFQTGVFFLAILSAVLAGVAAGYYIHILSVMVPSYAWNDDFEVRLKKLSASYRSAKSESYRFKASHNTRSIVDAALAVAIIGTIVYLLLFVASILLLIGTYKGKPKLFLPWMSMCAASIFWCIIAVIVSFAAPPKIGVWNEEEDKHLPESKIYWKEIAGYLISIPFQLYFLVVVLSFKNKLKFDYSPTPQIV